jgi:hypothetical protein
MHAVGIAITEFVSDEQPGWVRCRLTDAAGQEWQFVEKVPVVSRANLTAQSAYPQSGEIDCLVLSTSSALGRSVARIDTSNPWGVESVEGKTVFEVFADQLREVSGVA